MVQGESGDGRRTGSDAQGRRGESGGHRQSREEGGERGGDTNALSSVSAAGVALSPASMSSIIWRCLTETSSDLRGPADCWSAAAAAGDGLSVSNISPAGTWPLRNDRRAGCHSGAGLPPWGMDLVGTGQRGGNQRGGVPVIAAKFGPIRSPMATQLGGRCSARPCARPGLDWPTSRPCSLELLDHGIPCM